MPLNKVEVDTYTVGVALLITAGPLSDVLENARLPNGDRVRPSLIGRGRIAKRHFQDSTKGATRS
jgi:hypothetical protein